MLSKHEIFDFNNAGHGIFGIAKELHAHRARMVWHAMQDPARAGNQTIATFFLNARQAGQKLVGDVFTQAFFTKNGARNIETFFANQCGAIGFKIFELKAGHLDVVNLAQIVIQARHF